MPRIGQPRLPVAPVNSEQVARRDAILSAGARLARSKDLDCISAQEIAAEAGVALRTLYRYYPSKYHVFAELLTTQIDTIKLPESRSGSAVAEFMAEACRNMLRHKHLAGAMIISTQAVRAQSKASGYHAMRDVILQVAGVRVPTEDQIQAARLVEQVTFGVLMWTVGGELDTEQAIADVRLACRLLVADVFPEQES